MAVERAGKLCDKGGSGQVSSNCDLTASCGRVSVIGFLSSEVGGRADGCFMSGHRQLHVREAINYGMTVERACKLTRSDYVPSPQGSRLLHAQTVEPARSLQSELQSAVVANVVITLVPHRGNIACTAYGS